MRGKHRWELLLKIPGGHKYYRERLTGRIGVADQSGMYPEDTDDGVLYLDPRGDVTMGRYTISVPVIPEFGDRRLTTIEAAGDCNLLTTHLNVTIVDRHGNRHLPPERIIHHTDAP